jgi:hypothetical protein
LPHSQGSALRAARRGSRTYQFGRNCHTESREKEAVGGDLFRIISFEPGAGDVIYST